MTFICLHLVRKFAFTMAGNRYEFRRTVEFEIPRGNLDLQRIISYEFTAVTQNALFLRK